MNRLSLLSLLLFTLSCGQAPEEPKFPHYTQMEMEQTIIVTKAAEGQRALNCQLSLATGLVDQFEWINPSKTSHVKILKSDKTSFAIKLAEPWEEQGHLTILFRKADKKSLLDGSIHDQSLFKTATLYENVETEIHQANESLRCIFIRK